LNCRQNEASEDSASMLRLSSTACAISLLLAVAACSDDSGLPKDAAFGGMSQFSSGQGVVIVGMRMTSQAEGDNLIIGKYDAAAWFLMRFRGIDMSNQLTDVTRGVQVCDQIVSLMGVAGACDPTIMVHRVLELPAGRYVLSDFTVNEDKLTFRTSLVGGAEGSPFTGFHRRDTTRPRSLVEFDVKPGEITYIGDFNWDPRPFPAQCVVTRDDLGARAALFDYPQIQGPIVFQAPTVDPVAAYPKS
jgi:hypothetical protein